MKRKLTAIAAIAIMLSACGGSKVNEVKGGYLKGLASPIQLTGDTSKVLLADYITDYSVIDSISVEGATCSIDKGMATVIATSKMPWLTTFNVWIDGAAYAIPVKKSEKQLITLTYTAAAPVKTVAVAGGMNGWNPSASPMVSADGKTWTATFLLAPGKYPYQLVVDGKWMLDPANGKSEDNGQGGRNSVLNVVQALPNELPMLVTSSTSGDKLEIEVVGNATSLVALWQNYVIPAEMIRTNGNVASITIPANAKSMDRSFIRVWAVNGKGYSNDALIPLAKRRVVTSASELTRHDKQTMILYSLMVDRFKNGNTANDWKLNSPEVLPIVDYYGGDLAGITDVINNGYFDSLGVNTLWLSPITQNPYTAWGQNQNPKTKFTGYHGYWPITLTTIDKRFGTNAELTTLLDEAHGKQYNVILDYVANHVHQDHPMMKQHPDWATQLVLPDGSKNIGKFDEHRLTTWFDEHLPTLDLARPEIYQPMTDTALFWVKNFDFDGYRHDATKHIPLEFWRELTKKAKQQLPADKQIYQIGETYGSPELIGSYVSSGMLDAQFDFNVYDAAIGTIANEGTPFSRLTGELAQSLKYYGSHNLMGYITGNHDRGRFISYAGGSLSFNEDAKAAGWTRTITVGDTAKAYKRLSLLEAFIATIPGVPVIYYGDEFGVPGGNDPDNRHMAQLSAKNAREQETFATLSKLLKFRRSSMPLLYGDFQILSETTDVLVFARVYFGEWVVTALNKSGQAQNVKIKLPSYMAAKDAKANFGAAVEANGQVLSLSLQPYSFELLSNY